MNNPADRPPAVTRRCTRCTREAIVVVVADPGPGTVAACAEHLEWAFFVGVAEWSGRRRAA